MTAIADDDLDSAIERSEQHHAAGATGFEEKGLLLYQIGILRWERYRRARSSTDYEAGRTALAALIDEKPSAAHERELHCAVCNEAGRTFYQQGLALESADTVAQALQLMEAAAECAPDGEARRGYRGDLAQALSDWAWQTGGQDPVEQAANTFRERIPPPRPDRPEIDPNIWAACAVNLAAALSREWTRARAVDDMMTHVLALHYLEEALDLLRDAVGTPGLSPEVRVGATIGYAESVSRFCARWRELLQPESVIVQGPDTDPVTTGHLDGAEAAMRAVLTDGGEGNAAAMHAFVELLVSDWELRRRPDALREAIPLARGVLEAMQRESGAGAAEASAEASGSYARVLAALPPDPHDPDFSEAISEAFRVAATHDDWAALEWARWAVAQAGWTEASEAFGYVEAAVRTAIAAAPTLEERLPHLGRMTGVATYAAFVRGLAGDVAGAIDELEHDRGMFLWGAITGPAGDRSPPTASAGAPGPSTAQAAQARLERLAAEYPDTAVVFLVPAPVGGVALVARPDAEAQVELLPELDNKAVELQWGRFWGALLARRGRGSGREVIVVGNEGAETLTPQAQFDAATAWLWEAAMRRVVQLAGPVSRIALVPSGMLVGLPLHCAWHPAPDTATGRHYAIDDREIVYLPTTTIIPRSPITELDRRARALVVQDPRPSAEPELASAADEATAVRRAFPGATVIAHADATPDRVTAALSEHELAHLICHGHGDPVRPLDSHLVLSDDEHLSVADVIGRDLSGLRLAVLSACESASPSQHMPEAPLSLPAAFHAAGVSGVIGSLWEASDVETSLLMARFYASLGDGGTGAPPVSPSAALRSAQIWLRDTTNAEKAETFPELMEAHRPAEPRLARLWSGARPTALQWAPFVYSGR